MSNRMRPAPPPPPGGWWQAIITNDAGVATTVDQARRALTVLFPDQGPQLAIDPASPDQVRGIWRIALPGRAVEELVDRPRLRLHQHPYTMEVFRIGPTARKDDPYWLVNHTMHELARRHPGIVFSSSQLPPAIEAAAALLRALGLAPIDTGSGDVGKDERPE